MSGAKKNLSKLERVPLREAWKHEAGDFKFDILSIDRDGLLIIDNQRDKTNHFLRPILKSIP